MWMALARASFTTARLRWCVATVCVCTWLLRSSPSLVVPQAINNDYMADPHAIATEVDGEVQATGDDVKPAPSLVTARDDSGHTTDAVDGAEGGYYGGHVKFVWQPGGSPRPQGGVMRGPGGEGGGTEALHCDRADQADARHQLSKVTVFEAYF